MWLVSQLQQNIETLLILYIGSMQETNLVWTNLMPNRSGKVKFGQIDVSQTQQAFKDVGMHFVEIDPTRSRRIRSYTDIYSLLSATNPLCQNHGRPPQPRRAFNYFLQDL